MFHPPVLLACLAAALAEPPVAGGLDPGDPGVPTPRDEPSRADDEPIINGEAAEEADWPMAGGVILDAFLRSPWGDYAFRSLLCSSTLIAPDVVLLAAHCVDETAITYGKGSLEDEDYRWSRRADLSAFTGMEVADWPADAVSSWDRVFHDEWDLFAMGEGVGRSYDVGLLFLDTAVLDVPFAYLPLASEASQIATGVAVEVVGWGQQTPQIEPPPGTVGYKRMGPSEIGELGTYEMQVGPDREDVRKCHGDSGGPTFLEVATDSLETWRIVGVTSHAYDATQCRRTGGVDTRVDAYLEWIDREMRERCEAGTRAWCDEAGIPALPYPPPEDTGDSASGPGDGEEEGGCGCGVPVSRARPPGALLALGMLVLARRRGDRFRPNPRPFRSGRPR